MSEESFLCAFNKFLGNEIPECILNLLEATGFDTQIALELLTTNNISEIENYVGENRSIIANTIYEKKTHFTFLPGHRQLLLCLPEKIKIFKKENNVQHMSDMSDFSFVMKSLIENVTANKNRDPKGIRYNEVIKHFSIYIYLLCGRSCYDTLCANLPIPKTDTILHYVNKKKLKIIEGELRCAELLEYLGKIKSEKYVWLSEDASGIVSKVEYDPNTNLMMGFVLPFNSQSGMPIKFVYPASSSTAIKKTMETGKMATSVYVVMAQPIILHAPPFVLQIYGTDGSFDAPTVANRWIHTTKELKKYGINVLGFSSDGDPRLLSAMQRFTELCTKGKSENDVLFKSFTENDIICIQDSVHIGTKNRNRLIKPSILLPIGNKIASVSHLKILINNIPKEKHGLVLTHICPDDRQNFGSMEKVMNPRVLDILPQHVLDSEATVIYLKICSEIVYSFIDINMSPVERINRIWHATYFLRIWKRWLDQNSKPKSKKSTKNGEQTKNVTYDISKNFISPNAYKCVEINSHNLIRIIRKLRFLELPHLFIPIFFSSQACEETFRQLRSMGTINFTKINFSLLELLHSISRVELQNDIVYDKLANIGIIFPRNKINANSQLNFHLPNDDEIKASMENARENALRDAASLGMFARSTDITYCVLEEYQHKPVQQIEEIYLHLENNELIKDSLAENSCANNNSDMDACINDYTPSRFIDVELDNGTQKSIRKSTYIWMLSDSKNSLSNDRLKRVQMHSTKSKPKCKRHLNFNNVKSKEVLIVNDEIQIGDNCIFRKITNNVQELVFGTVVGFKYNKGTNEKMIQYSLDFAPVHSELPDHEKRGIDVLASWFHFQFSEDLRPLENLNCFHISIENYIATSNIVFKKTSQGISIDRNDLEQLTSFIRENQPTI